jgi:hypothetical protein
MSHQRSRHGDLDGGSWIGARYRHTTDAMALRVLEAVQARLTIALRVAEECTPADRKEPGGCTRQLPYEAVRTFCPSSRLALRSAGGRPPARQRRHGHRATGLTR